MIRVLVGYLIMINVIGFFAMGIDKWKARKQRWRVPEKTLFILSLIGGSLGTLVGMHMFRHKTKHWYFKIGMPVILILHCALAVYLIFIK